MQARTLRPLATSSPSTRWIATTAGRGGPLSLKSGHSVVASGVRNGPVALRAGEQELRHTARRAFGIDTMRQAATAASPAPLLGRKPRRDTRLAMTLRIGGGWLHLADLPQR